MRKLQRSRRPHISLTLRMIEGFEFGEGVRFLQGLEMGDLMCAAKSDQTVVGRDN